MIGIDIVKISRIERMIERFGDRALEKFLDQDEISLVKKTETAAGFFAAKEAVSKALGVGIGKECSFFDIKIHKDSNNAPYFTLKKSLVEKFRITKTSLSISHEKEFAIAIASITSLKDDKKPLWH
ncbi:MAG: holo-ACP synthase [Epsilonproteobacteria bacterium]|nr:holo-ACP synthase [Campylobacterota bacterium]